MFGAVARLFRKLAAIAAPTGDSLFANVKLLVHANGNGNDTIGHAISVTSGTPTFPTTQPRFGSASMYANGAGGESFDHADFIIGTGDFCFECWAYPTVLTGSQYILRIGVAGGLGIGISLAASRIQTTQPGVGTDVDSGVYPAANVWFHVAACRFGGNIVTYVNGTSVSSFASTTNFTGQIAAVGYAPGGAQYFNGYIDEVRLTIGNGRYLSNFSVPTAAFPDFAVDQYMSSVVLLMHFDNATNGANSGTSFRDEKGHSVTIGAGTPTTSTTSPKFGASSFLGAASSQINVAYSADWAFGTGDFTVEFFAYVNNAAAATDFFGNMFWTDPSETEWYIDWHAGWGVHFGTALGGVSLRPPVSTTYATAAAWFHVAFSRVSGILYMHQDGVMINSVACTWNLPGRANPIRIGYTGNSALAGKIDELRITKGVGRYVSNFTVPVAPFPDA